MIVAVDFDGVLCEDAFPRIGTPHYDVIQLVREIIDAGHEVVLWTARADGRLTEAVEWCEDYGLRFCAVNENAPSNRARYEREFPGGTRKVYADVYLDDKSAEFRHTEMYVGHKAALYNMVKSARKVILNG